MTCDVCCTTWHHMSTYFHIASISRPGFPQFRLQSLAKVDIKQQTWPNSGFRNEGSYVKHIRSVHLVTRSGGLYRHNPTRVVLTALTFSVSTSKTSISSEEPNSVSLKKKERGLAGHSAVSCLSLWNDSMYCKMLKTIIDDDVASWCPWNQTVSQLITYPPTGFMFDVHLKVSFFLQKKRL